MRTLPERLVHSLGLYLWRRTGRHMKPPRRSAAQVQYGAYQPTQPGDRAGSDDATRVAARPDKRQTLLPHTDSAPTRQLSSRRIFHQSPSAPAGSPRLSPTAPSAADPLGRQPARRRPTPTPADPTGHAAADRDGPVLRDPATVTPHTAPSRLASACTAPCQAAPPGRRRLRGLPVCNPERPCATACTGAAQALLARPRPDPRRSHAHAVRRPTAPQRLGPPQRPHPPAPPAATAAGPPRPAPATVAARRAAARHAAGALPGPARQSRCAKTSAARSRDGSSAGAPMPVLLARGPEWPDRSPPERPHQVTRARSGRCRDRAGTTRRRQMTVLPGNGKPTASDSPSPERLGSSILRRAHPGRGRAQQQPRRQLRLPEVSRPASRQDKEARDVCRQQQALACRTGPG